MNVNNDTILECLRTGKRLLLASGVPDADIEAELLLAYVLGIKRLEVYNYMDMVPDGKVLSVYRELLSARTKRIPFGYLTGQIEFMGHCFKVKQGVALPRADTETLVEALINIYSTSLTKKRPQRIIDLCTGVGNILISLCMEWQNCEGIGIDIDDTALECARENARNLGLENRVVFLKSDLYACLAGNIPDYQADVITANPPYVSESEYKMLSPEIKYEPVHAFLSGHSGVEMYERIIPESRHWLRKNGRMVVEISPMIEQNVIGLYNESSFHNIQTYYDIAGRARVIMGCNVENQTNAARY